MDRREFLLTVAALPFLGACGKSDLTFKSESDETGHDHGFTIPGENLKAETALSGNTSTTAGHSHELSFSRTEMTNLVHGSTITKTSSVVNGHSHTFVFSK